jgi:DNA-binding HxlR family transcriptional regulator
VHEILGFLFSFASDHLTISSAKKVAWGDAELRAVLRPGAGPRRNRRPLALLIVRELLLLGSARYTELQDGLPGIATNLLAQRLEELTAAGLIVRERPPGRKATVVRLTPRGLALEPAIAALSAWGAPLLGSPRPDDVVRGRWLVLPLRQHFTDSDPKGPKAIVELHVAGDTIVVTLEQGMLRADVADLGPAPAGVPRRDLSIDAPPDVVLALLAGRLSLIQARRRGAKISGDVRHLKRIARKASAVS